MNEQNEQLATLPVEGATAKRFREATDAANVCKAIVLRTACDISGRKYVKVEGWMSIAVAHGCIASIKLVEDGPSGIRAVAELKRGDQVLTTAEGFVGRDEPVWYGGKMVVWDRIKKQEVEKTLPKRADYAIRAMAQTRALSRVCRTAFAHVVVLMDAGLETVPAEEVDNEVIDVPVTESKEPQHIGAAVQATAEDLKAKVEGKAQAPAEKSAAVKTAPPASAATPAPSVPRDEVLTLREQFRGNKWEGVKIHFGQKKGETLGSLPEASLRWWTGEWQPKPYNGNISQDDLLLRAALDVAAEEALQV
jgi:hypothetical protein